MTNVIRVSDISKCAQDQMSRGSVCRPLDTQPLITAQSIALRTSTSHKKTSNPFAIGLVTYKASTSSATAEIAQGGGHSSLQFKITDFGTNRKTICDFLLLSNTNLHPFSRYRAASIHQINAFDRGASL